MIINMNITDIGMCITGISVLFFLVACVSYVIYMLGVATIKEYNDRNFFDLAFYVWCWIFIIGISLVALGCIGVEWTNRFDS